ncbi:MAG TPA: sigma-70 family RNA polymerase sigma factor [Steroidobacteraceae bacterium]|nr:sigma-70 family RNA polymerase sigma factor [Steroidobacteraceae bacterium]
MCNENRIESQAGLVDEVQMVTDDMVALVPQLHTFARSLCRDGVRADDLVQEALMRAINNIQRFKPGTNLKAWLFTIVRNEHYSQLRRGKFEAQGMDIELLPEPSVPPDHDGKLELRDLNRALASLSPGQRTALILVSVSGFSYEEAAEICGCAVGTIKSRVARARETLLELLEGRQPMAPVPDEDLQVDDPLLAQAMGGGGYSISAKSAPGRFTQPGV